MKKVLSILLVLSVLIVSFSMNYASADSDIFMLIDGESINGAQDAVGGHGFPGDLDYENYTQGESALVMFSLTDELQFFYSYGKANNNTTFNATNFDYFEADIMSYDTIETTMSIRFVGDDYYVDGYKWKPTDAMFFPKNKFVHLKIPISDFTKTVSDEASPEHSLSAIWRIFIRFYDPTDINGDTFIGTKVAFDNVCLTRNGKGSPHTLMTRSEYEVLYPPEEESSTDEVSSEIEPSVDQSSDTTGLTQYLLGDVNINGTIGSDDALAALQHSVGKIELDELKCNIANVDGNDGISSADALCILQYAVKKIDKFPAGDINIWL